MSLTDECATIGPSSLMNSSAESIISSRIWRNDSRWFMSVQAEHVDDVPDDPEHDGSRGALLERFDIEVFDRDEHQVSPLVFVSLLIDIHT